MFITKDFEKMIGTNSFLVDTLTSEFVVKKVYGKISCG